MGLPFSGDDLAKYINIVALAIIGLCVFVGFIRATRKSLFYFIATIVIIVGGLLLSNVICDALLAMDLSSMNLSISVGETSYTITSAKETLEIVLKEQLFGNTEVVGTYTYGLILGLIHMVFRVVWFIILIVLSFTVFKIISDIVWLIVKPKKKRDESGKKIKIKKTFTSRLGGAGIGLAKGLLYLLLLFFIVAGIVSVAESYNEILEGSTDDKVNVVLVDGTATLVQLGEESNDETQEIIDLLLSYKNTIPGKVFGTIKLKGTSFDEFVFDQIFKIKVEGFDGNLKIRKELATVANVLKEVPELLEGELTADLISEYAKDPDKNAKLKAAVQALSELDLINVVVPVGIEVVVLSETLFEDADEDVKELIKGLNIDELRQINYGAEFSNIGCAFVDILSLLDDEGEFNFLSLDSTTVDSVFNSIGNLQLLDVVAPVAISYVITMPEIKETFEEMGIDVEALGLDKIEDFGEEVKTIGKILSQFSNLGLTEEVLEDFTKLEVNDELIAKLDEITETLFKSNILKNAVPVVAKVALNSLPEEYLDVINIPDNADGDYWKNELTPLLKAGLVLLSTGIFDAEDPDAMMEKMSELSDAKIDELAKNLSESSILTDSLNSLIPELLSATYDEDGNLVKEGLLGNLVVEGFEDPKEWNQTEIASIFKAVKVILSSGFLMNDDITETFNNLSDQTINDLAQYLSNSKFITLNLSPIISSLVDGIVEGAEWKTLEASKWTKEELTNLFQSFKKIISTGLLNDGQEALNRMTDAEIDELAASLSHSEFISQNLSVIVDVLVQNISMGGTDFSSVDTSDIEWTEKEIASLLKSAKLVAGTDITELINLPEDDMDSLVGSKLISKVFIEFIKNPVDDLALISGGDLVDDNDWTDTITTNVQFTYVNGIITITSDIKNVSKYYVYIDGDKVVSSASKTIDLNAVNGISSLPTKEAITVEAYKFGEIRRMFLAIQTLCEDGEINTDSIIENMTSITDEDMDVLFDSIVFTETLICQIEEFASEDEALVSIPEGPLTKVKSDGTKDRTAWLDNGDARGELYYVLKAITTIFDGGDIDVNALTVAKLVNNQDTILRSLILSETIKKQIVEIELLELPKAHDNASNKANYIKWNNTYSGGEVTATGELAAIFNVISDLCVNPNVAITNIEIDFSGIFDSATQAKIVKSKVISETIIQKLSEVEQLNITNIDLLNELDRTAWWDAEKGELIYLLNGVEQFLTAEQKKDIANFNLDIDVVYDKLIVEESRTKILQSYVLAETIKANFVDLGIFEVPTASEVGVDMAKSEEWYVINDDRTIEQRELWHLIESVHMLLGDDVELSNYEFNVDELFENQAMMPIYNFDTDGKLVYTADNMNKFFNSKVMQKTFADLLKPILEEAEGELSDKIVKPAANKGGLLYFEYGYNQFVKSSSLTAAEKSETIEFDTKTIIEAIFIMNAAGLSYKTLDQFSNISDSGQAVALAGTIAAIDVNKLVDAFVISRTFRGSIESILNPVFEDVYNLVAVVGTLSGRPIAAWDTVKLVNADYAYPMTKKAARDALYTDITTIINNIKTAAGV